MNRSEVKKILGGRKKVAFVMWGLSIFLEDNDIAHAVKTLYDWADPGSCLVFNAQAADVNTNDPAAIEAVNIYKQIGTPIYLRQLDTYRELLKPWKFEKNGFVDLLNWHGFDQSELSNEDATVFGPMGGGFGAYLVK